MNELEGLHIDLRNLINLTDAEAELIESMLLSAYKGGRVEGIKECLEEINKNK